MAKSYVQEMSKLPQTLDWASTVDLAPLEAAVRSAAGLPLRAIGSGGSLSAAHALAYLHRHVARQLSVVETPLEAAAAPVASSHTAWLLSAGGGNVDILSAFGALAAREGRQVAVLCGRADSPLGTLAAKHPFVDFLSYPPPAGRDGFLATNSLLGFVALLTRAYLTALRDGQDDWASVLAHVQPLAAPEGSIASAWQADCAALWARPTTIVLHGSAARLGAVDLESKFTEAALGNLQTADWRNFAHGRHHWLAKRGEVSGILALVGDEDAVLADRTLALIPADIPVCRIRLPGPPPAVALASLVAALHVTGWAGAACGIDPGRPGVPDFGRKLYNLPLPKPKTVPGGPTPMGAAAIRRKSGLELNDLESRGELARWRDELDLFRRRLTDTSYAGVVLDYDGTLVDLRRRFSGPEPQVVTELVRLLEGGAWIGVATGRGGSVRRDLQTALPQVLWPRVLVGYYNGADIALLGDDSRPDRDGALVPALQGLADALAAQPELAECATLDVRPRQITLQARRATPEFRLWDLAHQVILAEGRDDVVVTRSSHSIDIVPRGVSKREVVTQVQKLGGEKPFLSIGDRGRWPGNDYDLLRSPFALSVDEVSVDPQTAWHLGPPGQRGVEVTVGYLQALQMTADGLRFTSQALK